MIDFLAHPVAAVVIDFERSAHEAVALLFVNFGFHKFGFGWELTFANQIAEVKER